MLGAPPVRLIVHDVLDGFHRIRLGVADEADRSALDPACRVDAVHLLVVVIDDLTLAVGNHAAVGVERDAVKRRPEVADSAVQALHRNLAELAGTDYAALAIGLGPLVTEALNSVGAKHLDGARVEVQVQATRRRALFFAAPLR